MSSASPLIGARFLQIWSVTSILFVVISHRAFVLSVHPVLVFLLLAEHFLSNNISVDSAFMVIWTFCNQQSQNSYYSTRHS